MDNKLMQRIEKIRQLAERGVGGEKATAQKKLDKLLKDNGLTLESLESEQPEYYLFSYSNKFTMRLLHQVIYKVMGGPEHPTIYKSKHTRNKIGVFCTPSQKLEIDLDYEFYCNLLDLEFNDVLEAFIQVQEIFPEHVPVEVIHPNQLSPEDKERIMKQQLYQHNMNKRTRSAMIEDKNRY